MATSPAVLLLLLLHSGAALEIRVPNTHKATVGSAALIPCYYTIQKPPVDPKFFAVFWHFQGKEILSYDDEVRTTDARYSLNIEKALNGEVDLSISNILLSDEGVYTCTVIYSPERKKKDITVNITVQTARPQIVIADYVTIDKERVLRCSVTGFYPMDINIEWFRGTERMTDVTIDEPWRNSDGTYNVKSTVVIIPTDEDKQRIFSCRVRHESLPEPLQEDFQLTNRDKNVMSWNYIHISIIVSVLGILGIIAVVVYYKKRQRWRKNGGLVSKEKMKRTSTSKETSPLDVRGKPHPQSGEIPLTSPNKSTSGRKESTGSPPVRDVQSPEWRKGPHAVPGSPFSTITSPGKPHSQSGGISLTSPNISASGRKESTSSPPVTGTLPDLQIGEITAPEMILNMKATVECTLHNYDNGKHSITWYEKKSGTEEPIAANDQRRLQTIGTKEESHYGHTRKAYLIFTPVKWFDDGTEYIIRVKPSSFGQMIEKSTGILSVTKQSPSHNYKSPEKVTSPKLPEDQVEAYDERQTPYKETVEERHIQEPRKEGREGLCPVNESIHEEEKQKMPAPDHTVEKENDELGEYDNSEGTRKNGIIRAVCPANEAPGEERTEGPSLPTNGKKTDDLEERSTSEDEEQLDPKKEKEETSHLLNKPINEEETDKFGEGSTRKDDDDLFKIGGLPLINEPPREEKEETSQEGNTEVRNKYSRDLESAQESSSSSEEEDNEETSLMNTKHDTELDKSSA